ncbi:hypothetical protein Cgig2_008251 [Carnegiea gigantea]|uniref:50S ribosomal protein 6, chloroplastic n=1 Tax=Carnegiea gigantea TaxID=171969 RepID=A0A9Q1L0Q3_9CARY|nr:hypothetical protein Cgig2_008251 [Carnegiea gigantea]
MVWREVGTEALVLQATGVQLIVLNTELRAHVVYCPLDAARDLERERYLLTVKYSHLHLLIARGERNLKMSVSALFGTRLAVAPAQVRGGEVRAVSGGVGVMIECSSRPKKKATAHHIKTRPKKTHPWDIRRRPTVYPPLPPLPPDWTIVSPASSDESPAAPPVPESPAPSESQEL